MHTIIKNCVDIQRYPNDNGVTDIVFFVIVASCGPHQLLMSCLPKVQLYIVLTLDHELNQTD